MSEGSDHIDITIIGKYLSGEAGPEEISLVENWINASDENRKEFSRLERIWETSEPDFKDVPADVDTGRAWESIISRISAEGDQATEGAEIRKIQKSRHGLMYYALRVAAVIIIGAVGYILVNNPFSTPEKMEVVADNNVRTSVLPDSSRITLNVNSNLTFPEKFKSGKRVVALTGEAYFEVKHIEDKPFIVTMKDARVQVLGTEFNVRDVPGEPVVSVTVTNGRVRFSDKDDISFVYLGRDEKGVLHRDSGLIEKFKAADENDLFWKTRTLLFRNTRLAVVFKTLEKIFNVTISVKNDTILDCTLTGKFTDASADEILNKISLSFDLHIEKENNTFNIEGDGCGTP